MAEIAKWFIVGMMALGALLTVSAVGKARKPLTSGTAAVVVAANAVYIVAIVLWWRS
jgi:hypothetical protein